MTLCHRTDSEKNPYVVITVSASGAFHGHYREHEGDVWFSGHPKEPKWGDIIPPFSYGGQTYQLNWNTAGQAIFNAGCAVPTTATSSAPSTTPPSRTHTHMTPPRRTTPAAATSTAATSTAATGTAATSTAAGTGTSSSSTTSAAAAPVVERSFLGEQIVAAPNGQRAPAALGGAPAAGPIPGGANAGLAAVPSGSGDTPLWAEVTLFGAAAAAAAGAVSMTRRRRRSH